jgi:hypothetical protein
MARTRKLYAVSRVSVVVTDVDRKLSNVTLTMGRGARRSSAWRYQRPVIAE